MRYLKRVSSIDLVGQIWMPSATAATTITLSDYDLENIRKGSNGRYNRRGIERWLAMGHSGDFQRVEDFRVTISDSEGRDFDSDFAKVESESAFNDCMYPSEE